MTMPTLFPHQRDGLAAVRRGLEQQTVRQLLKMPTGTGKTVLFSALPGELEPWLKTFPKRGAFMLVIAHREELLDQAAARIHQQNPKLMIDIEQGERRASRYSDVVIASIQTLAARKFARLLTLMRWHDFRVVIVDEAHHAAAASYRTALAHLGFLPKADISEKEDIQAVDYEDVVLMQEALEGWDVTAPKDRLLLGVTATPNRTDAIGLGCVFQSIVYSYDLKQAVLDGYLVPIVPWVIETAENLDDVRITHGEFNQGDLADTVNTPRRNSLAVDSWALHAKDRQTLVFTVDVAHAHDIASAFRSAGYRWEALSGETPKEDRRLMLRQIQEGTLQGIANCMVLTEGTDLPVVSCIVHAKPTKSATLYEQMTGRGLRTHPGKKDCIVLDLVDIARKHSLQTAAVLYGLPPGLKTNGKDLRQVESDLADIRDKWKGPDLDELLRTGRFTIKELQDRSSTFDIWKLPTLGAFGEGRMFQWIRVSSDRFMLSYPWADGHERLEVTKDMLGHWEIVSTLRPTATPENPKPIVRQRTLATNIPTDIEAGVVAEQWVLDQRRSVARMKRLDAPWAGEPATEKQLAVLRKWRVVHKPGITKGEASALLDYASARR